MPAETGTFTFNKDGSIDIPVEGKPTRFVKESDLLAVKGGMESRVKEWEGKEATFNTSLAEANRLRDEAHQNLLKVQAEREQLVSNAQESATLKSKVGELEKTIATLREGGSKLELELAGRMRHALATLHGATEEALKDKNLEQLRNLEDAAKILVGGRVRQANYDGGKVGAVVAPETPLDRTRRIIEEHEAKKGGRMLVSNAALK